MRSTKQVVDNHLRSFGERDLGGILSDYAADAVLFTPQGVLRGKAIRELFEALLSEFGKLGARFTRICGGRRRRTMSTSRLPTRSS